VNFATREGLYLLGFLMPLIILYLIRSKPKELTIPSLIFFTEQKEKKYNSILKKFLLQSLFFIQLLFIIVMAMSASDPIITIPMDAYAQNTVAVLDVSASMRTIDGGKERFDLGKKELLDSIKGQTTIILAEESPIVLARNVSSIRARALIADLKANDLPTRLDSAIVLATEMLGEERGNIIVYSDFQINKDDDIFSAKKLAESSEKRVHFIKVGSKQPNLGFTTLSVSRGKGEAFVRNYGDRQENVDVRLVSADKRDTTRLTIDPGSAERVGFDLSSGEASLEISPGGALSADNKISIINPYATKARILVISNLKNSPLITALQANSLFNVDVAVPPVIPDLNFDVVIVDEIQATSLLPNTFLDIAKYRDSGGKVILTAQPEAAALDFQGLVNYNFGPIQSSQHDICIDVVNELTSRVSNPRCFASANRYPDIRVSNATLVLASINNIPAFIYEKDLFYYGLMDRYSSFKEQIIYPLFWDDLINTLLGREDLGNYNFKTGDVLAGNESFIFDKVGVMELGGKSRAINLLDQDESNTYSDPVNLNASGLEANYEKINLDVNLGWYLAILAMLLLGYELYYVKRRGDL